MENQSYPAQMQVQPTEVSTSAPLAQEATNRSLVKYIFLGLITFGIYDIFVMTKSVNALNRIAGKYDGKKTINYCLMLFLIGWISWGVGWIIWNYQMCDRISNELQRRGYDRMITPNDYLLWHILGSLIIVGPFVYKYKFLEAMNTLSADYNEKG